MCVTATAKKKRHCPTLWPTQCTRARIRAVQHAAGAGKKRPHEWQEKKRHGKRGKERERGDRATAQRITPLSSTLILHQPHALAHGMCTSTRMGQGSVLTMSIGHTLPSCAPQRPSPPSSHVATPLVSAARRTGLRLVRGVGVGGGVMYYKTLTQVSPGDHQAA